MERGRALHLIQKLMTINNDSSKWPNLQNALKKTELESTPLVAVKVLRPLGWLVVRQMNESGIRFRSNSEEKSAP
jgi:hypothetical protein